MLTLFLTSHLDLDPHGPDADLGSGSALQRMRIQTGVVEPGPPQSVKWMYRYHLSKKIVQVKILDSRSRQE